MSSQAVEFEKVQHRASRGIAELLAWGARIATLVSVVAAPWFFGAVEAWVQGWIFLGLLVALGLTAGYLLFPGIGSVTLPSATVPLLLGLGWGVLQLVPLDRGVLDKLSPPARALADEFFPESGAADQVTAVVLAKEAVATRRPISVNPASTRQSLALLVMAAGAFFLGAVLFRRSRHGVWLGVLVAINGTAIAFFGLVQKLAWNGKLYWNVVLTQGGGPFGPFVCRNNAGGYLILCLAVVLGLLVWSVGRAFGANRDDFAVDAWYAGGVVERIKSSIASIVAHLDTRILCWVTMAACLAAAICCTLSRGSVVALLTATLVTATVVAICRRQGVPTLLPVAVMVLGLFLTVWVGLSDEVGARLSTLFGPEIAENGRWAHWQCGLRAASDFLRSGSGLGTYRFVYLLYQDYLVDDWFHYAENVYLQVLVEGGIVGLSLFFIGLCLVAVSVWRLLRQEHRTTTFAIAVTGIFVLSGTMAASCFDFGLFIPANFLLFSLVCGVLVGSAARLRSEERDSGPRWQLLNRLVLILFGVGLLSASAWGRQEVRSVAVAEDALRRVRLAGNLSDLSETELGAQIDRLECAARACPDNAELHRNLADLLMRRYQIEAAKELQATSDYEADDPRLAQLATPVALHARAWYYIRSEIPIGLDILRQSPVVRKNLLPAVEQLVASRQACPLLPEVHCGLAQLCGLVVPIEEDEVHIERTRRFGPSDPDLLYLCGLLDFHAGRFEAAFASWKASLTLSDRRLDAVLEVVGGGLAYPGIVEKVFPDAPELLVDLAEHRFAAEEQEAIQTHLLQRAESLLGVSNLPEGERLFLQGSILALREAYPEAVEKYEQALMRQPQEVEWRFELARLLQSQGRAEEALSQVRRCVRSCPGDRKYRQLLEEIYGTEDGLIGGMSQETL